MALKVFLCLTVLTTCYIFGGAYIFILLEAGAANEHVSGADGGTDISSTQAFQDFLATHPGVTEGDLKGFLSSVAAVNGGRIVVDNVAVNRSNETHESLEELWTFDQALLFAVSIVTTVDRLNVVLGYGHLTLTTTAGKLFCVFYTLLGVPAGAAQVASAGQHLRTLLVALHKTKPWYPKDKHKDQMIKSAVALGLGTVFILCVPSAVWTFTEQWDYATAVYFNTITLTTVGFGDYIAGMAKTDWAIYYRLGLALWMIVGLSWVALIVSEICDIYLNRLGKHVESKGVDKNQRTEEATAVDRATDGKGSSSAQSLSKL